MNAQKRQEKEATVNMLRATWDLDAQFIKCKRVSKWETFLPIVTWLKNHIHLVLSWQLLREKGGEAVMEHLDQMGIKEIILPQPLTEKEKLMKSLGIGGVGYDARGR